MAGLSPTTPEQEQQASKALWESYATRTAAEKEALLSQLESAGTEPLSLDFVTHEVRSEVEYRFFDTHPKSWDASSAELVDVSTIDAGEGGGSGS